MADFTDEADVRTTFDFPGLDLFDLVEDNYAIGDGAVPGGTDPKEPEDDCDPATSYAECNTVDDQRDKTCTCSQAICQIITATITIKYVNTATGETWEDEIVTYLCYCFCTTTP